MDNKIISTGTMKKAGAALVACVVALGGLGWYGHQQKITEFHKVAQANSKIVETKLAENNIEVIDEAQVKAAAAKAMGVDESGISWREIILCDGPGGHFMARGGNFGGIRGAYNDRCNGPHHDINDHGPYWNRDDNDNNDNYGYGGNGYHRGPHHGGHHYYAGNQDGAMNGPQAGQQFGPGRGPGFGMMVNNAEAQQANDNNTDNKTQRPNLSQQNQDANTQSASPRMEFHPVYNVICEANNVNYMVHVDAVSGTVLHCRAIASR